MRVGFFQLSHYNSSMKCLMANARVKLEQINRRDRCHHEAIESRTIKNPRAGNSSACVAGFYHDLGSKIENAVGCAHQYTTYPDGVLTSAPYQ
jgi:hypothetical protein